MPQSGVTVASDFFTGLRRLAHVVEDRVAGVTVESRLVYGGSESQVRTDALVVPWNRMLDLDWA